MQSRSCPHSPPCRPADATDHDDARIVSRHPEQGWNLLCNAVVVFDDTGELLPDGRVVAPHRPQPGHAPTARMNRPQVVTTPA